VIRAISALAAAAALAACATEAVDTPAWFDDRADALNAQGTPSLVGIPTGSTAITDPAHWNAVRTEMNATEAAMKANPRSAPLGANDTEAFEAEANAAIETTRNRY
jgi:hypothetical protein